MNEEWINDGDELAKVYAHFGERFSREQCLADLILLSRQGERVLNIRGNEVLIKKGQVAISIRTLCKRWSLANMTVQRLLRSFQHENLIKVNGSNTINIIDVLTPVVTQSVTQSVTQKVNVPNCDTDSYKRGSTQSVTQSSTQNKEKQSKTSQNTPVVTQSVTQSVTQKVNVPNCDTDSYKRGSTQSVTQSSTQNKETENLTKIPRAPAIDSIYNIIQDNNIVVVDDASARERVCVSADMSEQERAREDKFTLELKNAPIWQEQMCMRHKIRPPELAAWIETFSLDAECRGTLHDNLTQVKRHFNDWLRIQLREKKRQEDERDRQNQKNRRRGFEVSVGGFEEHATTF